MTPYLPRGLRNKNPGNIRHSPANKWRGLATVQADPAFCTFVAYEYGLRALAKIVRNYQLDTVRAIIERWAPATENDTGAYVKAVAGACGVGSDDKVDMNDRTLLLKLMHAIVTHENGQDPIPENCYTAALDMLGVPA